VYRREYIDEDEDEPEVFFVIGQNTIPGFGAIPTIMFRGGGSENPGNARPSTGASRRPAARRRPSPASRESSIR